jgi:F0F1-type ATP synthase delta subunit
MKYSPQQYASVFYELAQNKGGVELKKVAEKCSKTLAKNGDVAKSWNILSELEKISDKKNGVERIQLQSPQKPDAESLKKNFKKGTAVMWKQNKETLAGAIVQRGDERADNTILGRINKLRETLSE